MKSIHKKSAYACKGHYTLEHVATGKRYSAVAKNMQACVLEMHVQLKEGKHPCDLLQWLYNRDSEIIARCIPTADLPQAKRVERAFRLGMPKHLLIN